MYFRKCGVTSKQWGYTLFLYADLDIVCFYTYVLTRHEKHLNIRKFTDNQKREAYEKQHSICAKYGKHFDIKQMEGDHITPWHAGGKTNAENCQMFCVDCNRRKSGI